MLSPFVPVTCQLEISSWQTIGRNWFHCTVLILSQTPLVTCYAMQWNMSHSSEREISAFYNMSYKDKAGSGEKSMLHANCRCSSAIDFISRTLCNCKHYKSPAAWAGYQNQYFKQATHLEWIRTWSEDVSSRSDSFWAWICPVEKIMEERRVNVRQLDFSEGQAFPWPLLTAPQRSGILFKG